ncbi:MAG: DUF389 domain-containing protein, partial [Bacteroidales bacterium]|nr:DUF389 domain-containing protein [Bacteroidales bacterium]
MGKFSQYIKDHVNLTEYIDHGNASLSIRKNIAFKGPTVYILACAIIIASVGLNVNSIPVIIGAMLISPVMGPIIGFGFGLGVQDNQLVKDSLENFGVMVAISIAASTLFFILSPLNLENPSELLARTNPSIYDVMIALFGGMAGMLETSRKDRGTVLSGVAIATALMPPLCTVGYGLSILNWHYILGALYLFLINGIFIALASFLTTRYLGFPVVMEIEGDGKRQRLSKGAILIILLVMIVPSVFSAIRMVQENNFKIHAEKIVARNKSIGKSFIYDYKTNTSAKPATLDLYLAGETLTPEFKEVLFKNAEEYGITRNQIIIHEDATMTRDVLSESDLIQGIYEYNDRQIKALTDSIARLESQLEAYRNHEMPVDAIAREIFAQYPSIKSISLSGGRTASASGDGQEQVVALVTGSERLDAEMIDRLERWLKARLEQENVIV